MGNILASMNSCGASPPRASATGGTWIHALPRKQPGNRALKVGFFSSVSLRRRWGSLSPATTKKTHKWQSVLIFLSFTDLLLFLFFFILDLLLSTDRFFSFSFSFFSVSGGNGVGGVAAVVQALMVFAPLGISGGGRGRSAGGRSVQRRAGGWGRGRHLWVPLCRPPLGSSVGGGCERDSYWCCCVAWWREIEELEREGLSGEEGDGAMGVREKKMGCGVVVAAVFCVMWGCERQLGRNKIKTGEREEEDVATVWKERRLCLGWGSSALGWREERKSDEGGRGDDFKRKEKRKGAPPPPLKRAAIRVRSFFCIFFLVFQNYPF